MQSAPQYQEVLKAIESEGHYSRHDENWTAGEPGGGTGYAGENGILSWSPQTSRNRLASSLVGVTPSQVAKMLEHRIRYLLEVFPLDSHLESAAHHLGVASINLELHQKKLDADLQEDEEEEECTTTEQS